MKDVVFITGTADGIGRAIAKFFKQKDWFVIGLDKENDNEYTDIFIHFDLSKEIPKELLKSRLKDVKNINALINNAAVQIAKSVFDYELEELYISFKVNCIAIFELVQILRGRFIKDKSSILNIGSVHSIATSAGMSAYVATKGAVAALTRALALELAPYGIRVNSILPGAVNTKMLRQGLKRAEKSFNISERIPLKRLIEPEEIARFSYFLVNEGKGITGQQFIIDAGATAQLSTEVFEKELS